MEKLIEQFIKKVDRPWGMSIEELQEFQQEVILLKKENDRIGRLCDKLNKDYLKEKEISMYGMQELSNAMRMLKLEREELAMEKLEELYNWVCQNHFTEYDLALKLKIMIEELKGDN